MVTLNLFIESSLQIHCIRYQSEGTSLTHHLSTANCRTHTTTGCCCNTVAATLPGSRYYVILPSRVNTKALRLMAYFNALRAMSSFNLLY